MRAFVIGVSLALVSGAWAGAVVKISSNDPARVSVDGEDLGVTPMTLRDMKAGHYEIKLENVRTGLVQTYSVKSPKNGTVEREIAAKWPDAQGGAGAAPQQYEPSAQGGTVQAVPIAPPVPVVDAQHAAPVVSEQPAAVVAPVPVAAEAPPAPVPAQAAADAAAAKERTKVKTRNVVIGAAIANEVFNKGKSKDGLRKAAIGIGLLNEALNR